MCVREREREKEKEKEREREKERKREGEERGDREREIDEKETCVFFNLLNSRCYIQQFGSSSGCDSLDCSLGKHKREWMCESDSRKPSF